MSDYNEAPVSFNVKAISAGGYDCMLTIRGTDSGELMPRAMRALEWLQEQGFSPTTNGHKTEPARIDPNGANGNGEAPTCPTHGKAMKPSQYGGYYCPVKVADNDGTGKAIYCKQRIGE